VDGTRDQPPGKQAQNWGRRDGIRAGSVTGPWRSGPREAAAPVPRRAAQDNRARTTDTADELEPAAERAQRRGYAAEHHARAQRWLVGGMWIAFGGLVAVGFVLAAFMLRPDADAWRSDEPVPPEAAAATPEASVETPPPAAVTASGPLQGAGVVRLRIGPDFPAERRDEIVAALGGAGVADVRVEALPFRIASSRVGYYRAEDLPLAEALGRLISPVIAGGAEVGVRDYGQLLSNPEPGRLDLWVGD
jgi:hypothetical protein